MKKFFYFLFLLFVINIINAQETKLELTLSTGSTSICSGEFMVTVRVENHSSVIATDARCKIKLPSYISFVSPRDSVIVFEEIEVNDRMGANIYLRNTGSFTSSSYIPIKAQITDCDQADEEGLQYGQWDWSGEPNRLGSIVHVPVGRVMSLRDIQVESSKICKGETATLMATASSNFTYPQKFVWYSQDLKTIVHQEEVNSGSSTYRIPDCKNSKDFYVAVSNEEYCPIVLPYQYREVLLNQETNQQSTTVGHDDCINFYDEGGKDANYTAGTREWVHTFRAESENDPLYVSFDMLGLSSSDVLYIYNGPSTNSPLLYTLTCNSSLVSFQSPGPILTFRFVQQGGSGMGWSASIKAKSDAKQVSVIRLNAANDRGMFLLSNLDSVLLYDDDGGAGGLYQTGDNSYTFTSMLGNVKADFSGYALDIGAGDTLFVYDGDNTESSLLATYTNKMIIYSQNTEKITSTGQSMTIRLKATVGNHMGFRAKVTMVNMEASFGKVTVTIKEPGNSSSLIQTTNDEVCYGQEATLTATVNSDIAYPQYFTWYEPDRITIKEHHTVYSGSDVLTVLPANEGIYYITVSNDTICPLVKVVRDNYQEVWMSEDYQDINLAANDSVGLYDVGGPNGNYEPNTYKHYYFRAPAGSHIHLHFNNVQLDNDNEVYIEVQKLMNENTWEWESDYIRGTHTDMDYEALGNALNVHFYNYSSETAPGWDGYVYAITPQDTSMMAKAKVTFKTVPVAALSAEGDEICYGSEATLTATSTLTPPQYFTWFDQDHITVLKEETIYTAGEESRVTVLPPDERPYYVAVTNDEYCPVVPTIHNHYREVLMDGTQNNYTILANDSIGFFDAGGRDGSFNEEGCYNEKWMDFSAPEGSYIRVHINSMEIGENDYNSGFMRIYNSQTGEDVARLIGEQNDKDYVVESNRMTIYFREGCDNHTYSGWDSYIYAFTPNNVFTTAEVPVNFKQQVPANAINITSEAVCNGSEALLTASSTIAFPQNYTWYASDRVTVVKQQTVEEGEVSTLVVSPEGETSYFVTVSNVANCPVAATTVKSHYREIFLDDMYAEYRLSVNDSVGFFDAGGPNGDYEPNQYRRCEFLTPAGSSIRIHFNNVQLDDDHQAYIKINVTRNVMTENGYGEYEYDLMRIYGTQTDIDTVISGFVSIVIEFYNNTTTTASGWDGYIYAIAPYENNELALATATYSNPVISNTVRVNDMEACIGKTITLTASNGDGTYRYVWYDENLTLLKDELGEISNLEVMVTGPTTYYVNASETNECPVLPPHYGELWFDVSMNGGTTYLTEGEAIPFYDAGGPNASFNTPLADWIHTFVAPVGKQVTLQLNDFNTRWGSVLYIYDGTPDNDPLAYYEGYQGNLNEIITSTTGKLTLRWVINSGGYDTSEYPGWEALIGVKDDNDQWNVRSVDLSSAQVSLKAPIASSEITTVDVQACYGESAILTASTDLTGNQTYYWYDENLNLIKVDSTEISSSYVIESVTGTNKYYLTMGSDTECPFVVQNEILLDENTSGGFSYITDQNSIRIYSDESQNSKQGEYTYSFTSLSGSLYMMFDRLSMNYGDTLIIYDGTDDQREILAKIYRREWEELAYDNLYVSATGSMVVKFIQKGNCCTNNWSANVSSQVLERKEVLFNADKDGKTTYILPMEAVDFYDEAGPNSGFWPSNEYEYSHTFTATQGRVKVSFKDYVILWSGELSVYDGTEVDESALLWRWQGKQYLENEKVIESSSPSMTFVLQVYGYEWNDGWYAEVTSIPDLASTQVTLKSVDMSSVTTTNPEVCYGQEATLMASSDFEGDQYYFWYAPDRITILKKDTVQEGGYSSLTVPSTEEESYYVTMTNETTCPFVENTIHNQYREVRMGENGVSYQEIVLAANDSIGFFDDGGQEENYSNGSNYTCQFTAPYGSYIRLHINNLVLSRFGENDGHLDIYNYYTDERVVSLYGVQNDTDVVIKANKITASFYESSNGYTCPGWDGYIYAVTPRDYSDLAEAYVIFKEPTEPVSLTTNGPVEICYGSEAVLEASSDLDMPQYFTWYDPDRCEVIKYDTVTISGQKSSITVQPQKEISYYVAVGNEEYCPVIPTIHNNHREVFMNENNKSYWLDTHDIIDFYDEGGRDEDYGVSYSNYYYYFNTEEEDAKIRIHFNNIELRSYAYMEIYNNDTEERIARITGSHTDLDYIVNASSIEVRFYSGWISPGWDGYIYVMNPVDEDLLKAIDVTFSVPVISQNIETESPVEVCYGGSKTLTATVPDNTTPLRYAWYDENYNLLLDSVGVNSQLNVKAFANTNYYVNVSPIDGCPLLPPHYGALLFNEYIDGDTTIFESVGDAVYFYDEGGLESDYYTNSADWTHTFMAPEGSQVTISFISFDIEEDCDFLYIYDGVPTDDDDDDDEWIVISGSGSDRSYTSISGSLTLRWNTDGSVSESGWSAMVGVSDDHDEMSVNGGLVSVSVTMKTPLDISEITTEDALACYGQGTTLTASSNIGFPQTHTWYDDEYNKLETITVNAEDGHSTLTVPQVTGSRPYYVTVSNDTACSISVMKTKDVLLNNNSNGRTTEVTLQNSVYFYDAGGKYGSYSSYGVSELKHTFTAPEGEQVYASFNSDLSLNGSDKLYVYDGISDAEESLLFIITDANSYNTAHSFQSSNGALTFKLEQGHDCCERGWNALISVSPSLQNREVRLNYYNNGRTTTLSNTERVDFYDAGGAWEGFGTEDGYEYIHTFTAPQGRVKVTFKDYDMNLMSAVLSVYDGPEVDESALLAQWQGYQYFEENPVFMSTGSSMTFKVEDNTDGWSTGWRAEVTALPDLANATTFVKTVEPASVVTTNDTICPGNLATLTASSDIGYPQYYFWYDPNRVNILKKDTVQEGGYSSISVLPSEETAYYVMVTNDTTCPFMEPIHNKLTRVFVGDQGEDYYEEEFTLGAYDSIAFYGVDGSDGLMYFNDECWEGEMMFYAPEGSYIRVHLNYFDVGIANPRISIYDESDESAIARFTQSVSDTDIVVKDNAMYMYFNNNCRRTPFPGWNGYVHAITPRDASEMVEAFVSFKETAGTSSITANPVEVCYGSEAVLEASSTLETPQYFTWYDADRYTVLQRDTVTVPDQNSSFAVQPLEGTVYYVAVANPLYCPIVENVHNHLIEVDMSDGREGDYYLDINDSVSFSYVGGRYLSHYNYFNSDQDMFRIHFDTIALAATEGLTISEWRNTFVVLHGPLFASNLDYVVTSQSIDFSSDNNRDGDDRYSQDTITMWRGYLYAIASHSEDELVQVNVNFKNPVIADIDEVTVSDNVEACYGETVTLTASVPDNDIPLRYAWFDENYYLLSDAVGLNSQLDVTATGNTTYYVNVSAVDECPLVSPNYDKFYFDESKNGKVTGLITGEAIPFFDAGGPDANYFTPYANWTHTFVAPAGKQVTLKLDDLNLGSNDYLHIYDGTQNDYGNVYSYANYNNGNVYVYTSTRGMLTVRWDTRNDYSGYFNHSGWEGLVGVKDDNDEWNVREVDMPSTSVSLKTADPALVFTTDTAICYGSEVTLSASSSVDFPQYHTWYAPDRMTILQQQTVNEGEVSTITVTPEEETDYYVSISNCPFVAPVNEYDYVEILMNGSSDRYYLTAHDSVGFFDAGGKTDDCWTDWISTFQFVAEQGSYIRLHFDTVDLGRNTYLTIRNGNNELARISGNQANVDYVITGSSLNFYYESYNPMYSDHSIDENHLGWEAYVYEIPLHDEEDLVATHVSFRQPTIDHNITTTNVEACYGAEGVLTATSNLTGLQNFAWYDSESNLLKQELVAEGEASTLPVDVLENTTYYVNVSSENECAVLPPNYNMINFDASINEGTTYLAEGEVHPFYDAGGPYGDYYTPYADWVHTFVAPEGKQVTFKINQFRTSCSHYLYVYDGTADNYYSENSYSCSHGPVNWNAVTSTSGALTLRWKIDYHYNDTYEGWEALVGVVDNPDNMNLIQNLFEPATVTVTSPTVGLPLTTTNDTVCYGSEAYLTAQSTIDYPQYYVWYAPDGRTVLLHDTVDGDTKTQSVLEAPSYYQYQDQTYYVGVGNNDNCPPMRSPENNIYMWDLTPADVNVKITSVPEWAVTVHDDTVCYGEEATLTASADLSYPQYYTWYNSRMEILLRDTLHNDSETESVLSLPAHYRDETYYAMVYSDTVSCMLDMNTIPKVYSEVGDLSNSNWLSREITPIDSVVFYSDASLSGYNSDWRSVNYYFSAESGLINIKFEELSLDRCNMYIECDDMEESLYDLYSGNYDNLSVTSCGNNLHIGLYLYGNSTINAHWRATVTNIHADEMNPNILSKMVETNVVVNENLSSEIITAINDTICMGNPAILTASTDVIDYPQYYTWYNSDLSQVLFRDTVTSGVSSYSIPRQAGNSSYYVEAGYGEACPIRIVENHDVFREYVFNDDMNGRSLYVGAADSLVIYDDGGKDGHYTLQMGRPERRVLKLETYPDATLSFRIPVLKLFDDYGLKLGIAEPEEDEEGEWILGEDSRIQWYTGSSSREITYTSSANVAYIIWQSDNYVGEEDDDDDEEGRVIVPTLLEGYEMVVMANMYTERQLAEAKVVMRNDYPIDVEVQTSVSPNASVCKGEDVEIEAASNLPDNPQYFVWYNSDMSTVVFDTVLTGSASYVSLPNLMQDTLMYVSVGTNEVCPTYPVQQKSVISELLLNESVSGNTTILTAVDSVLFFDDGGVEEVYSDYAAWFHTFKAASGQVILNFTYFETEEGYDKLYVLDGSFNESNVIAVLEGWVPNRTFISTTGSLTVYLESDDGYAMEGWEASVYTDEQAAVDMSVLARSEVTVHSLYQFTEYDTVTVSDLPYASADNVFRDIDISVPGEFVIDSVFHTSFGCDSIYTLNLKVQPLTQDVVIISHSNSWTYDGWIHTEETYTVVHGSDTLTADEGSDGKVFTMPVTGDVLTITPDETASVVYYTPTPVANSFSYTLDNEEEYPSVTTDTGTLEIVPVATAITITANSAAKFYDGTPLTNDGFSYIPSDILIQGDTLVAEIAGSITEIGDSLNRVLSYHVYRNEGFNRRGVGSYTRDVTDCYTVSLPESGILSVVDSIKLAVETDGRLCPGANDGTAEITVTGGKDIATNRYTYYVTRENTGYNVTGYSEGEIALISMGADSYIVTVTDALGLSATVSFSIVERPLVTIAQFDCPADIDTVIRHGGCNLTMTNIGMPAFTPPTGLRDDEYTIYNNAPSDHVYEVGETEVTWVVKGLCGDSMICTQKVKVSFQECPDAVDYEYNSYPSVRLGRGCKCWTTKNLKSEHYSDGREIEGVMSYYSYEFPNTTMNVEIYGYLYDWYSAADTQRYGSVDSIERAYELGNHIQGVCPAGWYLPSDEEYDELNIYPTTDLRSTSYWLNVVGTVNTNATGFNALPGGRYSCEKGRFEEMTGNAYYWSCHPVYDLATGAMMDFVCEKILVNESSRCNGYSIRCVLWEE